MYPTQYTTIIFVPVHMSQCHLTQYTHYVPSYLTTIPPTLSDITWCNYINFLTMHLRMSLLPKYLIIYLYLLLPLTPLWIYNVENFHFFFCVPTYIVTISRYMLTVAVITPDVYKYANVVSDVVKRGHFVIFYPRT